MDYDVDWMLMVVTEVINVHCRFKHYWSDDVALLVDATGWGPQIEDPKADCRQKMDVRFIGKLNVVVILTDRGEDLASDERCDW